MTFNPRASAERQVAAAPEPQGRNLVAHPDAFLLGRWEERNPLNFPGPFYGAETDTCEDGPPHAPASLLVDGQGQGFVWRQPRTNAETLALLRGAYSDPFAGFAWDGDSHWTVDMVRDWWQRFRDPEEAANRIRTDWAEPLPRVGAAKRRLWSRERKSVIQPRRVDPLLDTLIEYWTEYLRLGEAEVDLRRYVYFLFEGNYPLSDARLPRI